MGEVVLTVEIQPEVCDGCGFPYAGHNEEDTATCAEILRMIAEDEAEEARRRDDDDECT